MKHAVSHSKKTSLLSLPNFYQGLGWNKRSVPPNLDMYCFNFFSFPLESLFRFNICTILSNSAKKHDWADHKNLFHWNKDLNLWLKKSLQWGADYQEDQNILLLEKCSLVFPEPHAVVLTQWLVQLHTGKKRLFSNQGKMCVVIKQKEHIFVYVNVCMCIHICTYLHKHTHPSDYCQQKRYIEKYEIGENKVGRDQRTYSTYLPEEKQA